MKRWLVILPLLAAACSGGGEGGIDAETRAALDAAVLAAAPDSEPVFTEVALMGCRMAGGEPLCGACTVTVSAADTGHVVGGLLEEHRIGRTTGEGAPAVSATSELDHADFPHNGTRGGIEAAISDAHAWCEAFHPERFEVLRDVRDTEIATGDEE